MAAAKSGSRERGRGGAAASLRGTPGRPRRSLAGTPGPPRPPVGTGQAQRPPPRPSCTNAALRPPCGRSPSPTPSPGKWRREAEGWGECCTNRPPLRRDPETNRFRSGPAPRPLPRETGGRLPPRRQRPRHALSKNSLISNPLPPSRTQSLQPDFPQPSEMREISADAREPDSSWRCSKNCRRWRNNKARGTSAR